MFGIVINYSAVPTEAHIRDPDHLIHSPGVTSHGTSKVSCLSASAEELFSDIRLDLALGFNFTKYKKIEDVCCDGQPRCPSSGL